MRPNLFWGLAAVLAPLADLAAATPGQPSEIVRPFYQQPGLELEPEGRALFIDPGLRVLEQNDLIRQGGEEGCLDPALPFDDTDYVAEEVLSSLELREVVADEHATVVASFTAEGATHRVQWVLRNVDGSWKISDIFSMSKDWALSRFQCE